MNDDDRISYLAGEDSIDVDDATRADLDELRTLLADDALWAVPPAGLEDSIVAAIASEAAERPAPTAVAPTAAAPTTPPPPPMAGTVTSLATHRARRIRNYLTAAAAVIVLAVGGVFVATRDRGGNDGTAVALQPGEFGPGANGTAHVKKFDSGWRVMLDATGLPRLDDGEFYEAWLKDANGVLVPIGTFNEGADVVLWAGVSPVTFSTLTVTKETADGNQDSSKQVVLSGTITLDDAATS
jgi:hypothetical protein